MAAIITDQFRRNSAATVLADLVAGVNKYYIGIGKTDKWPDSGSITELDSTFVTPVPIGTRKEQKEVRNNLMSLIQVTGSNARILIPNVPWTLGNVHKEYAENDASAFTPTSGVTTTYPCYAVADGKIWLCLKNNGATLVQTPSGVALYTEYTGSAGSTWIAIANVENNSPFSTDQFISVVLDDTQYDDGAGQIANDATKGRVFGFTVVNGGTGYSGTSAAVLIGDGTTSPIPLTITRLDGVITGVSITGTNNTLNFTNASVVFTDAGGGSNAQIIANIAPLTGFGPTILSNLPTWFLGLAGDFDKDLNGDTPILTYRQISVIKNPVLNSVTPDTTSSADALKYLTLSLSEVVGSAGNIISVTGGSPSAAKAFFDSYVYDELSGIGKLYYHQNDSSSVNYGSFGTSGTININGSGSYAYSAVNESEYIHNTGQVLFIENRKPITRNANQKEEIKLVIQY